MPTTTRLTHALAYAAHLHRHQHRKGTQTPYLSHLISVAGIVADFGGDEDQFIAALLHDGPEDQGGEPVLQAIRVTFGDRVAHIVEACTDTMAEPKPPWQRRKEAYIEHLRHTAADARLVSAADKLHNARSILADLRRDGVSTLDRFRGKRDGTLWYYRSLADEFLARGPAELAAELDRVVQQIHHLAHAPA